MKPKQDAWSLIIAGFWNVRLFTPSWVSNTLFRQDNIDMQVQIMNAEPAIRYMSHDVMFAPGASSVAFIARNHSANTLSRIEELGCRLLEVLSHTPVMGIGLNFGFQGEGASEDFLKLFQTSDTTQLGDEGYEIERTEVNHRLQKDGSIVNVMCSFQGGEAEIGFNFHSDVTSTATALEKLHGQVLRSKEQALRMLNDIYHLSSNEED